jgi:hypothetical protein
MNYKLILVLNCVALLGLGLAFAWNGDAVSESEVAQLYGGAAVPACASWDYYDCTNGTGCTYNPGYATYGTGPIWGIGQNASVCGGTCGGVAKNVSGCGTVITPGNP